jgi:transcriptional regulator with XRE-family HTH domain
MKELTDEQLLRVARKMHGLSLKEMGDLLMCSDVHVSQIERGARRLTPIRKDRILQMLTEAQSWYLDIMRALRKYFGSMNGWYDETKKYLDITLGIRKKRGGGR